MKKYLRPLVIGVSEEKALFPAAAIAGLSTAGAAVVGVAAGLAVGRRSDISQNKWPSLTQVLQIREQPI